MEEFKQISVEQIEETINEYIRQGDWLEFYDYLQDSYFEEKIQSDPQFQKLVIKTLNKLSQNISFSDSEKGIRFYLTNFVIYRLFQIAEEFADNIGQ